MSEHEILMLAKDIAGKKGWPWIEPIEVRKSGGLIRKRVWTVVSNAASIGCNVRITVDDDGTLKNAAFCPR